VASDSYDRVVPHSPGPRPGIRRPRVQALGPALMPTLASGVGSRASADAYTCLGCRVPHECGYVNDSRV
jgi:hypothetical protein